MRRSFPTARGANGSRGPQVGPGTFDARSGPFDPLQPGFGKPEIPSAIVWSPGLTSPDLELWCYRTGGAPYARIDGGATDMLWVDEVPSGNAFQAPTGALPDSQATVNALKAYASERLDYQYATPVPVGDWTVQVARPYPALTPATPRKLTGDKVFSVAQIDRISGPVPVAWVWVTDAGCREIWLLYRPGELGGFAFPGTTPMGEPDVYDATSLRFTLVDNVPANNGWDVVVNYAQAIGNFKTAALGTMDCPALNADELTVHDFRIEE